ncbi:hypothetical protein JXA80_04875 [bacterium]|nr:hypothetical protein [candidate division CSSED10-310 bacterium]
MNAYPEQPEADAELDILLNGCILHHSDAGMAAPIARPVPGSGGDGSGAQG